MTLEERVALLEQKTQDITRTEYYGVPAVQINARVGVCTNFWMNKPLGEGAALSVASEDRFAIYAEADNIRTPNAPTVAIYGAVVYPNPYGQTNIGVLGVAANAPAGNYGGMLCAGEVRAFGFQPAGIELCGDAPGHDAPVLIGTMARHKVIYP